MRIAFLGFFTEEYCIRLANALTSDAEVLLLLPKKTSAPYLHLLNPAVQFQPYDNPRFRQPLRQLRMVATLLRRIHRFKPDVIHIQQGHIWFNLALPLLKRYPIVLTVHDPRHHVGDKETQKTPQAIYDFGFRRASQLIVHSAALKQVLIDECRLPAEKIHVIPTVQRGETTMHADVAEVGNQVLFFGRIWAYKGLDYLIRAEPLITAAVPDATIVIAGKGDDFDHYRRMMIHPERFIVYNDFVSNEKRAELFRQASVVALPYIDASQSGVIPIAYTFEKPVVATTVGGLPDLVEHNQTGLLVPPRDERALAEAIVRLLRDAELRRRFGANGKRKMAAESAEEVVAHKTLGVYHHAAGAASAVNNVPLAR